MSQINRRLQIFVPNLIHQRGSNHRQHLPAQRDRGLSFLHRDQHQHAMLLLRRSDAPLFIERRCVLVGRLERLDSRDGHHYHFYAGLSFKVLADGSYALFPIPIDHLSVVAHITSRLRQLQFGPIIGKRLG